jgi:hypothetical protein
MALADLLLGADPNRERWVTTGASMVAVDTLFHTVEIPHCALPLVVRRLSLPPFSGPHFIPLRRGVPVNLVDAWMTLLRIVDTCPGAGG